MEKKLTVFLIISIYILIWFEKFLVPRNIMIYAIRRRFEMQTQKTHIELNTKSMGGR